MLPGIRRGIIEELLHLCRRQRQPREIECQPPREGATICLGSRRQSLLPQLSINEHVDRTASGKFDLRTNNRHKGPVLFVLGPLFDPALERLNLRSVQWFFRIRRRHDHVGIVGVDAFPHQAAGQISRLDGRRVGFSLHVQPQLCRAVVRIRPVTLKAVFRQDGTDISIKAHTFLAGVRSRIRSGRNETEQGKKDDRAGGAGGIVHAPIIDTISAIHKRLFS